MSIYFYSTQLKQKSSGPWEAPLQFWLKNFAKEHYGGGN